LEITRVKPLLSLEVVEIVGLLCLTLLVVLLGGVDIGRVLRGVVTERTGGLGAGRDKLGLWEALRDLYLGKRL
jgi:hypothetical protein